MTIREAASYLELHESSGFDSTLDSRGKRLPHSRPALGIACRNEFDEKDATDGERVAGGPNPPQEKPRWDAEP